MYLYILENVDYPNDGIATTFSMFIFDCAVSSFGEGNDTPLQYSCLENPMDGGAW